MPKGRFQIKQNVEYVVKDKYGKIKKLFQPNKLCLFLLGLGLITVKHWKIPVLLGHFTDKLIISNLVTSAGKAGVADLLGPQGSSDPFVYIGVGTGTTAANATDTALETESTADGLTRATGTATRITTDVTNDTFQLVKSFSVTGTVAVTESGVLDGASGGVLLARQVFSAINVVNGDTLQITWKFDID